MNIATIKMFLSVKGPNSTTYVGPFTRIDKLPADDQMPLKAYRVWDDEQCGICDRYGEELIAVGADFIYDLGEFYRPCKGALYALYNHDGKQLLSYEWRHIDVKEDCIIAIDCNDNTHVFDLDGNPLD